MSSIIDLGTEQNRVIRWLQRAQDSELGGSLSGIYVEADVAVATDGRRIHVAPTEKTGLEEVTGQTVDLGTLRVKTKSVKAGEVEGIFPDWRSVIPKEEPVLEILLDRDLLVQAMSAMKGCIRLRVYSSLSPCEVLGETERGSPLYASIMPIYPNEGVGSNWKPDVKEVMR